MNLAPRESALTAVLLCRDDRGYCRSGRGFARYFGLANGKILVLHATAGTRTQMANLLSREGYAVETVDTSYDCVVRFVESPSDIVLIGLQGLRENELDMIRTLRREQPRLRILVTFPSPLREFAVRALDAGADAYILEPFYADEFVNLVRGQEPDDAVEDESVDLALLAREVAHAVNNPLQVVSLLLGDDKTPKRKLVAEVGAEIGRVREVVQLLEAYGSVRSGAVEPVDLGPVLKQAAAGRADLKLDAGATATCQADPRLLAAGLESLFDAIAAREAKVAAEATIGEEGGRAVIRFEIPRAVFADEDPNELRRAVFVVRDDRTVIPGLAVASAHFAAQGGEFKIERSGAAWVFTVALPR
ncbi:MAG: response regulator [Planctomycetota bacterium]